MRVSDYLGYLRDMSRKISFRGGFENCLNRTISAGVREEREESAGHGRECVGWEEKSMRGGREGGGSVRGGREGEEGVCGEGRRAG